MSYEVLKFLHILGAAVLFGTGAGIAFFFWRGIEASDAGGRLTVARLGVLADWLFTAPAIVAQPVTGYLLIREAGFDPLEPWLVAAYGLYVLAGACWLPVVAIQIRVRNILARGGGAAAIARPMRIWFRLGWPAFLSVAAIYWLMIAKPALWEAGP